MKACLRFNKDRGNDGVVVNLEDGTARSKVLILLKEKKLREAYELFKNQAQVVSYVPPDAPLPAGTSIDLHEDQF